MWERLLVGRPVKIEQPRAWLPVGDTVVAPTVEHLYERVTTTYHVSHYAYVSYMNELDSLLPQHVSFQTRLLVFVCVYMVLTTLCVQVEWQPYRRPKITALNLNSLCKEDEEYWTMRCPLICFYAVEYHLPHRGARQFGMLQPCPPEEFSTNWQLHQYVPFNLFAFVSTL
jgi:hypothetical protein